MSTNPLPNELIRAMLLRVKALEAQKRLIYEQADAQAKPVTEQIDRLKIAIEVAGEVSSEVAAGAATEPAPPVGKVSVRKLIIAELTESGPGSKAELLARFQAFGHAVNEATLGSTLSNLTRDFVLAKDKMNRYALIKAHDIV